MKLFLCNYAASFYQEICYFWVWQSDGFVGWKQTDEEETIDVAAAFIEGGGDTAEKTGGW